MSDVYPVQSGGAPSKPLAKEQKQKQEALAPIKAEQKKEGMPLWKVVNTSRNIAPFVLSHNSDELLNDPRNKALGRQVRNTYMLLDKALTVLGYKRDQYKEAGVPDKDQISWSWLNNRLIKFYKDQGLVAKDSQATSVRFGIKGLNALQQALSK